MPNRVVLHVGTMKSATTYLQHTWDRNRGVLAAHGVLWPGSLLNFAGFADRLAGEDHKRPEHGDWPSLVEAVERHDGTVLLSNELISLRRQAKLRPMVSETRWPLEVVITARDLGRVVPSQWVTGAFNRRPTAWPEFVDALVNEDRDHPAVAWFWRRQDLLGLIRTWSNLVGTDAVTLVTVPPPGASTRAVLERFMRVVGVDSSSFAEPAPEPAMGWATAELVRRLGIELPSLPRDAWAKVTSALAPDPAIDPPEAKLRLDERHLAWARSRAEEMASSIADSGVRVVGSLDDLIPGSDRAAAQPAPPTDAELLAVAQRALTRLAVPGVPPRSGAGEAHAHPFHDPANPSSP
jgi:hypothetical protein